MTRVAPFVVLAALASAPPPPAKGGNANGAVLLADGYDANLQLFQCLDCRFELLDGTAPTLAEATRGEIKSVRSRSTGRWIVSGRRVRFELLCDEEYLKRAMD